MKQKHLHLVFFALLIIGWGCSKELLVSPNIFLNTLNNTTPIADTTLKKFEGHYSGAEKNNPLGLQFICLVNLNTITFIGNRGGLYEVCKAGYNSADSTILMHGYYRDPLSSTKGFIRMSLKNPTGNIGSIGNNLDSTSTLQISFINIEED